MLLVSANAALGSGQRTERKPAAMPKTPIRLLILALISTAGGEAFAPSAPIVSRFRRTVLPPPTTVLRPPSPSMLPLSGRGILGALPPISEATLQDTSGMILSAEVESWRQYVPLGVSILVIFDILLGSPVANLILSPMKKASEDQSNGEGQDDGERESTKDLRERVDTEAMAQATLDRARNIVELNKYLEDTKSDAKRFDEMKKKLDKQLEDFDNSMGSVEWGRGSWALRLRLELGRHEAAIYDDDELEWQWIHNNILGTHVSIVVVVLCYVEISLHFHCLQQSYR